MSGAALGLARLVTVSTFGMIAAVGASAAPIPKEGTTPHIAWQVKAEKSNAMHDALVVGGIVVVGTDRGDLCAYRAADGKEDWKHTHGKRIFHRPAGDDRRVYFSSDAGLTAVSAADGAFAWQYDIRHGGGPVEVVPGQKVVVVGGDDGMLHAVDAETGRRLWTADFLTDAPPDRPGFEGEKARVGNHPARPSSLGIEGGAVFLSVFDQSRLVAFDVGTGKRLWSFQAGGWVYGRATATADRVFVGSQDKHLHCLDRKTGRPLWKFETKGRIESGGVADRDSVWFGSCDGGFYCVAQADGTPRWRFDTARDSNGRKSAIYSNPLLRRGTVVFAAGEGHLYAVAADTGNLVWKIRPGDESDLYSSPATDGVRMFVVTRPRFDRQGESLLAAVALK